MLKAPSPTPGTVGVLSDSQLLARFFAEPALEKILDTQRFVVFSFSCGSDDDPAAHFSNPVIHPHLTHKAQGL